MKLQKEINKLIESSEKKVAKLKANINEICEAMEYKDSSKFSYNIDRLDAYLKELKEFEILNK